MWSEKARHALDCMEGDSEKAKISYFYHWIDSAGMAHYESWKNNGTLLKQEDMNSGEFHSQITEIAKRCQFPNMQAEERAIRDALFFSMNSQKARDKAINLMNEEGKEPTVEFLMNQLEIKDCNSHHKSLIQLDFTTSVNFVPHDHRQNK